MSLEDFLAFAESRDERYEFVDGEVFAMTGARLAHEMLVSALIERAARQPDGAWRFSTHGPGERLTLYSLELELEVDAVYEGVVLSKQPVDVRPRES